MRKLLLLSVLSVFMTKVNAQITINAADMPVNGDTLRYSIGAAMGFNINLADVGTNKTWNFDTLTPTLQGVDAYKTAAQVNLTYAATISPTAYGYKVTDSLPTGGTLPVSVKDVYSFFSIKSGPSRFVAEAFAANVSGVPVPANYQNEDEWYFFPLDYGDKDTSGYFLDVSLMGLGSMKQSGLRITHVDAWGTIKTPYHTTPKDCIRVRSQVDGVDSVKLPIGPAIALPRHTVDYKWLVQGEHYPALWITTTVTGGGETISAVRYRDSKRPVPMVGVQNVTAKVEVMQVYPNPATDKLTVQIPKGEVNYVIEVFDMQGRQVMFTQHNNQLDVQALPAGTYILRATLEQGLSYSSFVKQ